MTDDQWWLTVLLLQAKSVTFNKIPAIPCPHGCHSISFCAVPPGTFWYVPCVMQWDNDPERSYRLSKNCWEWEDGTEKQAGVTRPCHVNRSSNNTSYSMRVLNLLYKTQYVIVVTTIQIYILVSPPLKIKVPLMCKYNNTFSESVWTSLEFKIPSCKFY